MCNIIELLESKLSTAQQESGLKAYIAVLDDRAPSLDDFVSFYLYWCFENMYYDDLPNDFLNE